MPDYYFSSPKCRTSSFQELEVLRLYKEAWICETAGGSNTEILYYLPALTKLDTVFVTRNNTVLKNPC